MGSNPLTGSVLPGLRNVERDLNTEVVKAFKGINLYSAITNIGPDTAVDCKNVIVNNSGGLSKMRYPSALTPAVGGLSSGPTRFYDFQQGSGTRQVLASQGNSLYSFNANTGYTATVIDTNANNAGNWDFITSNNLAFFVNGTRAIKWNGVAIQNWGIAAPGAPQVGMFSGGCTAQRAANVVTVTLASIFLPSAYARVGDPVVVTGAFDGSFNGTFAVASVTGPLTFTYNQVGANAGPGACTISLGAFDSPYTIVSLARLGNSVLCTLNTNHRFQLGWNVVIAGAADASFNGTFKITAIGATTVTWLQQAVDLSVGAGGTCTTNLTPVIGYQWRIAYGNSVTGHVSASSPPSQFSISQTTSLTGGNRIFPLQVNGSSDAQVDTIYLFRNLDGGGDFYLVGTFANNTQTLLDGFDDSQLNTAIQAPLLNLPPIVGKYLCSFQGRIFITGLAGAPQDIIYSGYERILLGRPEESFPPNNRLRLALGADDIRGMGVIQAGVIAFSRSNRMYMFRGIVEDVVVGTPLLYAAYLEELPWKVGAISHYTIQGTPYGLVWLASDKTVQIYDGTTKPQIISLGVVSLLRDMTKGYEFLAKASYLNWLDREWFVLTFAYNGSTTNNRILFFDLNPNPDSNVGIFISDLEADDIEVLEDPVNGARKLCISFGGIIYDIMAEGDVTNGLSLTPRAPTGNTLAAYWKGGYFGTQTPQTRKMFRAGRVISDDRAQDFSLSARVVDDEDYPVTAPYNYQINQVAPPKGLTKGGKYSVNRKGIRCGIDINFPAADKSVNIVEMHQSYRPSGDNS